jgi:hypothetical protein
MRRIVMAIEYIGIHEDNVTDTGRFATMVSMSNTLECKTMIHKVMEELHKPNKKEPKEDPGIDSCDDNDKLYTYCKAISTKWLEDHCVDTSKLSNVERSHQEWASCYQELFSDKYVNKSHNHDIMKNGLTYKKFHNKHV